MLLEPNPANICFGCGGANARGMKLTFLQDDAGQRIRGAFKLGAEYQGGPGFIHGGIIATVLDEAMSKVSRFRQVHAVTAELTVEYLKPVWVDEDLMIEAYETARNGRVLQRVGEIRNLSGELLARGRARFVEIQAAAGNELSRPEARGQEQG
ncbi:MAG TPA: PaaI family thioesterase [Candidatus Acidoferrales bacterium]|nr:PaaI family thioesterase [Candidatus Acidoferrales bacterium]